MEKITYLTKAASKGDFLRTTVPMSIVKQFVLTDEDKRLKLCKLKGS